MRMAHRRHDMSDRLLWQILEPLSPDRKGMWATNARDNRLILNVMPWILQRDFPWRNLPPGFDNWKNGNRWKG